VGGNAEVAGMIEFFPIRPNLTEVVLTLDYDAMSPLQKACDTLDRFLNRQLSRIEGWAGFPGGPDGGLSGKFA
jgi:hypothetical protein